jgi:hypothetical protein
MFIVGDGVADLEKPGSSPSLVWGLQRTKLAYYCFAQLLSLGVRQFQTRGPVNLRHFGTDESGPRIAHS